MISALFLFFFFLSPSVSFSNDRVHIKTADDWTIAAIHHAPKRGGRVAVLIHGAQAGKEEWESFAAQLWSRGWGTLALDLRGHGESARPGRDFHWLDQSDAWPSAAADIEAASRWLAKRGVPPSRQAFIGASIGANLAALAAAKSKPAALVLLSPGLDYRGVVLKLPPKIPTLAAASPQDAYATQAARAASQANVPSLQARAGHGVQMFSDPEFQKAALDWLDATR